MRHKILFFLLFWVVSNKTSLHALMFKRNPKHYFSHIFPAPVSLRLPLTCMTNLKTGRSQTVGPDAQIMEEYYNEQQQPDWLVESHVRVLFSQLVNF